MSHFIQGLKLNFPITLSDKKTAQLFADQQVTLEKKKQVYFNVLAVKTVSNYLQCLGIANSPEGGDSWDMVMQTLADTADLEVDNWGTLECRPVLPHAQVCIVPEEVWDERKGYVAVQFNHELPEKITQGTFIGFLEKVAQVEVPLEQFQPMEILLGKLPTLNQLSHWFKQIFPEGWHSWESLLTLEKKEVAFAFRSPLTQEMPKKDQVKRGKFIEFSPQGERISLLVGIEPIDEQEMDISVEIFPRGHKKILPHKLQMLILDDEGDSVMNAEARSTERLEFKFSGEIGEQFAVQLVLGDSIITEHFVI
ncbi:DUF1822 family protein [Spirulina subsalsa FACHB-351]|uniref:DUF1822 family protein n=1 Tax=Spirulina subsalsa FACHB-351 TaxID=234711 RepID=A0ABT3L6V5_9CYAN|nr:DUF1822 family protein [Spirulina subsalsa]MCW6037243.1 DUF1822 family protein [Spirulina subsalsa FACHB-351]